jgi:hypothetical protein
MRAPRGQLSFRAKQTPGHSAFQSLVKIVIAAGKRELIHQRVEVEIIISLFRMIRATCVEITTSKIQLWCVHTTTVVTLDFIVPNQSCFITSAK